MLINKEDSLDTSQDISQISKINQNQFNAKESLQLPQKKRAAQNKLKSLLDHTQEMNETLTEENQGLRCQQRSLLFLLQEKDKQIESFQSMVSTATNSFFTSADSKNFVNSQETLINYFIQCLGIIKWKQRQNACYAMAKFKSVIAEKKSYQENILQRRQMFVYQIVDKIKQIQHATLQKAWKELREQIIKHSKLKRSLNRMAQKAIVQRAYKLFATFRQIKLQEISLKLKQKEKEHMTVQLQIQKFVSDFEQMQLQVQNDKQIQSQRIKDLQDKLNTAELNSQQIQKEFHLKKQALSLLQQKCSELQDSYDALSQDYLGAKREEEQNLQSIQLLTKTVDKLAEDKQLLSQQVQQNYNQLNIQKSQYQDILDHNKILEEQINQLQDTISSNQQQISSLKNQNYQLTVQNQSQVPIIEVEKIKRQLKEQIQLQKQERSRQQNDQHDNLLKENDYLKRQINELQKKLEEKQLKMKHQYANASSVQKEQNEKFQREIKELRLKLQDQILKNEELELSYKHCQEEIATICQQNDLLLSKIGSQEKSKQNDIQGWIQSHQELKQKNMILENTLKESNEMIQQLQAQLDEFKTQYIQCQQELQKNRQSEERSKQEVHRVLQQMDSYARVLEAMEERVDKAQQAQQLAEQQLMHVNEELEKTRVQNLKSLVMQREETSLFIKQV